MRDRIGALLCSLLLAFTADGRQPLAPAPEGDPLAMAQPRPHRLLVGDPAPPLSVAAWIKAGPIERFEPGKVYLVEFWATWCAPCRKSIPHLSDLQARHRDRGLVVVALSAEPRGPADVEPFIAKQGDRITYAVALDDAGRSTRAYIEAAGLKSIPTAFIVDRAGRIAWIGSGYPMRGLDSALASILDGTYDLAAAAARDRTCARINDQAAPLIEQARAAERAGNFARAIDLLDKVVVIDACGATYSVFDRFRLTLIDMADPDRAYEFVRGALDGPTADRPHILNAIAWLILDDPRVPRRDAAVALRAAERANELTDSKAPEILDTLALACFQSGQPKRAIELQTRALELADDPDLKSEIRERLDRYRAATR